MLTNVLAIIIGDYLYIDGGEVAQLIDGEVTNKKSKLT